MEREITVTNRTDFKVRASGLEDLLELLESRLDSPPGELSFVFVGDEEISRLNVEYYGREGVTDVLAFPYEPDFAEIILNPYQHHRQADKFDNNLNQETVENIIHALLHLAGLDHTSEEDDGEHLDRQHNLMEYIGEQGFPEVIVEPAKNDLSTMETAE